MKFGHLSNFFGRNTQRGFELIEPRFKGEIHAARDKVETDY